MPFRIALGLVDDDFLNFTGKVVPNRSSLASEAQDLGRGSILVEEAK